MHFSAGLQGLLIFFRCFRSLCHCRTPYILKSIYNLNIFLQFYFFLHSSRHINVGRKNGKTTDLTFEIVHYYLVFNSEYFFQYLCTLFSGKAVNFEFLSYISLIFSTFYKSGLTRYR